MVTPLKVRSSIQRFLFSSGLMLLAFSSYAQKTQIYEQAEETFYHGIELYEKKQYGASIQTFERFLKQDKTDHLLDRQAELYILIGHLQLNHYNADKNLDKELKRGPKTALDNLAIFELGNYYYRTKKFRKAARMYEDLDISNLNKELWAEASFKMGYSFFMSDDYDQAKTHFNNVRNQPGTYYVEANYYYGYICYASKDFDCALKSFKRIEGQGPEIVDLYIAQMYYAEGGYQQALDKCAKSNTEKYPEEYNLLLAKCYFQLEKYAEASKKFAAIDLESELLTTEDIYMIGYSNFLDEKYQDATKAFVKLSGQESALGQLANYQLGQSFIKLDDKQKALNALGVAKRMNFHAEIQEISHYNYARLSYELGAKNSAIQTTQEFIANYPESEYIDDAKGMMADMLVTTNNYTQAIRYLDEIKSFTPRTKDVYQKITYAWAESLFIDGNYEEAKTYFKKSLRFTPNRVKEGQAYYWLGEIAFAKEDYPAAINNYTRMMNNSSASSSRYANFALYNLGYAYYVQKEYSRALNYFLQFQSKSSFSQNREVYADNELRLGDCYFLKKQYDKAKQAYGQVSGGKHPGSDYALYQQGIIYGLLRDPSNKISSLKRIQTDYKSSIYLDDAIYQIAETYLQDLGNPEMAMSMYNLIVNQHENSIYYPAAHVKIGLIFFQKGDNEKALDYFKTVISKFPRTKSSQEAMSWMESVYVKMGKVDEYLDYLASIENGDIRVTYSDSLLYQTTLQKYRTNDCEGAVKGFNDYKRRFAQNGFFLIHAYYYSGECAFYQEKYDLAAENYEYVAAQSQNEFSEDVNFKLAEIYYYQRRYDKALPFYSKLERLANSKTNYVAALMGQMRCNYTLGNMEAAKKNATAILPIENIELEKLIETNLILGKIQYDAGNLLTAMFHFDYVVKESKTERGAESQYYRCQILFKQTKYDESRKEIFALGDKYAPYEYWVVKGFVLLADIYTAEEDYFQARATLQSILDGYDGDQGIIDEIKQKLAELDILEKS